MSIEPVIDVSVGRFKRTLNMVGMFCCMIENLTYGIEKGTSNDGTSAHICRCV